MVVGTHAGIGPGKPHDVLGHCLDQLTATGMVRIAALRAITSIAARTCGLGDRKGRLAPGCDADLLAVDGDPSIDPGALRRVVAVAVDDRGYEVKGPGRGTRS